MKRWLIFLLILTAAAFARTEASSSYSAPHTLATASLTQSTPNDIYPVDSPLVATTLPCSETLRTGNTAPTSGNSGPSFGFSAKGHLHPFIQNSIFHSHKICGQAELLRVSYPRPADHFVYAFRKIVI